MTPAQPVRTAQPVQSVRGPNFTYLMPPGWQKSEEGQFSLVLYRPDFGAWIIVSGQSGLLYPVPPEQFAYECMANVMRFSNLRLTNPRPCLPRPGYSHAAAIECIYTMKTPRGPVALRGVVVSHVAVGYGQCSGTITISVSAVAEWPQHAGWLPQVAAAAVNTGPNAYGTGTMAAVMHNLAQQDHANYQAYQQHSNQLWQEVVDDRHQSIDRQQEQMGELLTGHAWHHNPYGGPMLQRSTTPAVIWRSRDGREIASDNPTFDPRTPTDCDWRVVR